MPKVSKIASILNYLVISIMFFMIMVIGALIYTSIHMKNKMIFHVVQHTELISELLARSTVNIMGEGHGNDRYSMVLSYGNMIGVDDIGIFKLTGEEAFSEKQGVGKPEDVASPHRRIGDNEKPSFDKAIYSLNSTGFFDQEKMSYSQYVPLMAEGSCVTCHKDENEILGVLKIRLSAEGDFELLNYVQKLIWTFGLIVFLPFIGLLIAGVIIREKTRISDQLKRSNENLTRTYDELGETKYYLQKILDNSKALIITTDTEGRIVEFNKEAENLLEYGKNEVIGKNVLMLYEDTNQRNYLLEGIDLYTDNMWVVRNREVLLRSKSGRAYHVSLTLSPMLNDKGRVIGTVGIGKDTTEQKMLQFKLLQSEKLAGIGTLASGIAHEINNPLAGILGMAEAIVDEDDIELIKSHADDIIKYALTASDIVKELSSYSRATYNTGNSTVDLSSVIEDSLKMTKHSESFNSIELVTDLQKDCSIIANSGEMQQIFVNLTVNAIHAMGSKGTLTLRCRNEGTFMRSEVTDTGCGIPEENISQIFDPFFTTKPVGKGTGLGLYVVYKIITKYKGSIEVKSTVGQGTTFVLKFPSGAVQS